MCRAKAVRKFSNNEQEKSPGTPGLLLSWGSLLPGMNAPATGTQSFSVPGCRTSGLNLTSVCNTLYNFIPVSFFTHGRYEGNDRVSGEHGTMYNDKHFILSLSD